MNPTNEPVPEVVGYAFVPVLALPPFRSKVIWYGIGAATCMVLGVAAFYIPIMGKRGIFGGVTGDLVRWLSDVMRHTNIYALIYLGVFAFVMGLIPRFPMGTVGPLMMFPFFMTCAVEFMRGTGSNLLPIQLFELLFLATYCSIFAVFGYLCRCAAARVIKRKLDLN